MKLVCKHPDELDSIAARIIEYAANHRIWLLEGEMGAGKTTLTKSVCRQLGVTGMVNSPTFSIVNEYHSVQGEVLYHFDFYRLKNEMEALDIGCEEYFDSGCYCFIEWGSRIPSLIPPRYLRVSIETQSAEAAVGSSPERVINLSKHE